MKNYINKSFYVSDIKNYESEFNQKHNTLFISAVKFTQSIVQISKRSLTFIKLLHIFMVNGSLKVNLKSNKLRYNYITCILMSNENAPPTKMTISF